MIRAAGPSVLTAPPCRRFKSAGRVRNLPGTTNLQFHNILIYVLLGSAVITAALGHVVDTLVILAVVIANGIIGFIQGAWTVEGDPMEGALLAFAGKMQDRPCIDAGPAIHEKVTDRGST